MNFYISFLATKQKGLMVGSIQDGKLTCKQWENSPIARGYVISSRDKAKLFSLSQDAGCELVSLYDIKDEGICLRKSYPIPGGTSCHLTESPDGKFIFIANYGSGTIDVLSLETGKTETIKPQENGKMHMVSFRPDSDELFAVDLGNNCLYVFDFKAESLRLKETIKTKEGAPRHLAFFGSDTFYLIYENANLVEVFQRINGHFACVQSLSSLPENCNAESYGGAIKVFGNKLYVSNRGHDSITTFEIGEDGLLENAACFPLEYHFPRDFALVDDRHMLISFQKSDYLVLYEMGEMLSPVSTIKGQTDAVCVCLKNQER